MEGDRVRAIGTLLNLQFEKKLATWEAQEANYLSYNEMEKWIEDYVERETLMATQRVVDAETAIKQEQEVMRNAEKVGLITKQPETTFEEMLNAIRDSLTNLATSDDGEDGEYQDDHSEDLELGKMSEHDKPGWVMGTITKTVLPRKDRFQQKPMELDELTQQGC